MKSHWRKLVSKVRQLALVEEGVAAVEFAMILPIMLFVYVGSVEASTLISIDRRVQSVAGSLGDLVSRAQGEVKSGELLDYFRAAGGIMTPYPTKDLRQTVTQVAVDAAGKATVVWSYEFDYGQGNYTVGTKYIKDATYALPTAMASIAYNNYVIVAEAKSSYTPLSGFVFDKPVPLQRDNFFMPRFGKPISVN